MNKKVVAIIPARGGSKTVPKKNIMRLGGYPLIAYTIAVAKLSSLIEEVIVSTDSEEIAEIARQYGAEAPFLRPAEISQDNSTDIEFFEHYINFEETENRREAPEYLVHLRPTSPFREIHLLEQGIETILGQPEATALRSVNAAAFSPYKLFTVKDGYLEGFFKGHPVQEYYNLPRQAFRETFIPNGYVDVVRSSVIKMDSGLLHGEKMLGFITYKIPDIDTYDDYEYASRELMNEKFKDLRVYLEDCHG